MKKKKTVMLTDVKKRKIMKLLKKVYLDPASPGSFSSPSIVKKVMREKYKENVPLSFINRWVGKQRPYFMHKPAKQNFKRNPVVVSRKDEQWQGDLLFLPDLAQFNQGVICHLLVVDVLSRFMWVEPMKNKTGVECTSAFKKILDRSHPRKPQRLQTDDGKEFFNHNFQELMKVYKINHFSTKSDLKAALAERAIKTIKEKIYKYLSSNPLNNNYLSVLQDIVSSYNNTYHSSIGMAPSSVTSCNSGKVLWRLYHKIWEKNRGDERPRGGQKLHVGDFVRYSSRKFPLSKRYRGNWTEEIFKIVKIKDSVPRRLYKLEDLNGEEIQGGFYEEELQLTENPGGREFWQVEEILQTRDVFKTSDNKKTFSHKEYLVKWFGYPDSFNEWVHEKNISTLSGESAGSDDDEDREEEEL